MSVFTHFLFSTNRRKIRENMKEFLLKIFNSEIMHYVVVPIVDSYCCGFIRMDEK